MHTVEETIFKNLILNDEYSERVLPYLSVEYFQQNSEKVLFKIIDSYFQKYNKVPSIDDIVTILSSKKIDEKLFKDINDKINVLKTIEKSNNVQWLIDTTEDFCRDRALYNAVSEAVNIYEGKSKKDKGSLNNLFETALGISFNKTLGTEYFEDAEKRYEYYHKDELKYSFDIDIFNKITKGGFSKKTLNIFVAAPGTGKTLVMLYLASCYIKKGLNVLYISLEMSEEKLSERVDMNLLDLSSDELHNIQKDVFLDKILKIKKEGCGIFKIKEYATSTIHKGYIKTYIKELELKEKFKPDILFIDYINIMLPMNNKYSNSYEKIKNICEEVRGLGVELDIPVISATQTNRSGMNNTDLEYENIAESTGIAQTADFILGISTNEDFKKLNQILFKQLKNRYNGVDYYNKFLIGIDYKKMRLYDIDNNVITTDNDINTQNNDNNNNNDLFGEFKC